MYKILCDENILYHPLLEDYPILKGKLEQSINKAGTLDITLSAKNKALNTARTRKSVIELYDDGRLLFKGRPYAPGRNLFNDRDLLVVGELFYLNDSIYEAFDEYYGPVDQFFHSVIDSHNSQVEPAKQFKYGICNVVNSTEQGNIVRSSEKVLSTWEIIEDKLIEPLGGYLRLRYEEDGTYIDYLKDPFGISDQTATQCINLLKYTEEIETDDLATAIYPLGAKVSEDSNERVVVTEVNNGSKIIRDEEAINTYGYICRAVYFDDITEPANLLKAGRKALRDSSAVKTVKFTAADLSKAGYEVGSFKVGQKVTLQLADHSEEVVVENLKIDLLSPSSSTLSAGKVKKLTKNNIDLEAGVTESIIKSNAAASKSETANNKANGALNEIKETETRLESSIDQTAKSLETTISESVYSKGDTDKLISQKLTEFSQTADSFEMVFNKYDQTIEGHDTVINDVTKSIKFDNGEIIVGNSESSTSTRVTNEQFNVELKGEITTYFDIEGTHSRNVDVENQVKHFGQWATRKGAKRSHGNNLNIVWIG